MKAFFSLYFDRLARWIRDVLSTDGNQSSMRLVLLASWGCVLFVWTSLSIFHHAMQPIDGSVLALLGIGTGGKCWQNHVEASHG